MESTTLPINQKEYLKKYLAIGKAPGEKKKKKKKKPTINRVQIIDDDADVSLPSNVTAEDLELANEDAPQIVAIIDERPPSLRFDEKTKNPLWQPIGSADDSDTTEQKQFITSFKIAPKMTDKTFAEPDKSPPRKKKKKTCDDDKSPPRRSEKCPKEITIKEEKRSESRSRWDDGSPHRKSRSDTPPRPVMIKEERRSRSKSPQKGEKDGDISPPRRNRMADISPPRRRRDDDISPPRKSRSDDISPPRRGRDTDVSPPRGNPSVDISPPRKKGISPPRKNRYGDISPPRKTRSGDMSPPRRRKYDDVSPPRKNRHKDNSPPRRNANKGLLSDSRNKWHEIDNSPRRKHDATSERNNSPPRIHKVDDRGRREDKRTESSNDKLSKKMEKTLDGKSAGLQNARELVEETKQFHSREDQMFKTLSKDVSGENAETVHRDRKTGRIRNIEEEEERQREKREEEEKNKEKYSRWGRGLVQVENREEQMKEQLYEMSKPLARYADDEDLEKYLKEQEREGDPMLAYIRKKKKKKAAAAGEVEKPQFEGEFMPNRYGIRPGHRWDGVDRSNGYEKKWFEVQNAKRAQLEDSYKWSTEDM